MRRLRRHRLTCCLIFFAELGLIAGVNATSITPVRPCHRALGIRFYGGVPLTTPDGHNIGTLCVIDRVPRHLTPKQREALARLGRQVVAQLELRRINRRLAEQAAFQKSILINAPSAIIATTPEGVITHFNRAAEQMLGYSAEEMIEKSMPAVFHDPAEIAARAPELSRELGREVAPDFEFFVAKARAGQAETREWVYVRKDGSRLPVLLSVNAMRDEERNLTGFLGITRDLTERNQATEALLEREAQLRDFLDNSSDLIQSIAPDGRILFVNRAWCETLGYSAEAAAALNIYIFSLVHPDCRAHCEVTFQRLMNGWSAMTRMSSASSCRPPRDWSRLTSSPCSDASTNR